jgi:pimeloyl-ACP methyl ester carboxylesterase
VKPGLFGRCVALLVLLFASLGTAAQREQRVPLKEGVLHVADLSKAICHSMDLPGLSIGGGDVPMQSSRGQMLLQAVNLSLGRAGNVSVEKDALVVRIDPQLVPGRCDELSRAGRVLAAEAAPQATARQAKRWGLFIPQNIDSGRPLVILVHGLDSDRAMLGPMADLLNHDGYQVGYFSYPGDQPIDDSAASFTQKMIELHEQFPKLAIDIVAHSMGGLVAREYIEGNRYAGSVDHLIMIGTPNGGSSWSKFRFVLSLQQHYNLWRHDPDWSPSWYVTEGFGEAGRDLAPASRYLKKMSALPRRAGVHYTIIAGTQHPASRISADCCQGMSDWFGGRVGAWWGFRQCKSGLTNAASHFRNESGPGDGPVPVKSAKLAGVSDLVLLPADHIALFCPMDGHPPAAWDAVRARLAMK